MGGALALKILNTVFATTFALTAGVASADIYMREGTEEIDVRVEDGVLYCTRLEDSFEMCHGMTERVDGTWRGKKMKHPGMPRFMSFNGTVTFNDTGLNIRGCALGICDAEDWTK